jgi:hypothetical protein
MIRIEGIPVVADRLADAQKAKSTQARNMRRRTSKIDAGGQRPLCDPFRAPRQNEGCLKHRAYLKTGVEATNSATHHSCSTP